jgi:hypothetical protein
VSQLPNWELIGMSFGERVGGDRAIYRRHLDDGTLLVARVRDAQGRPECDEITAKFPNGARDFGRELAVTELEQTINDNDKLWYRDPRTGDPASIFVLSEIPVGVPVRGSRGRQTRWTETRLAELVRDLQNDDTRHWHFERNTLRQRANEAVRRGIAEVATKGPPKRWRLAPHGQELLRAKDR